MNRLTVGLIATGAFMVTGFTACVAAAGWYVWQDPTPQSLAIAGVALMVVGIMTALMSMPSPYESLRK